MNKNLQFDAMAKILGWSSHPRDKWIWTHKSMPHSVQPKHTLPDWIEDRNAMAKALGDGLHMGHIEAPGSVYRFPRELDAIIERDRHSQYQCAALATIEQQREAFLRTWDAWEETPAILDSENDQGEAQPPATKL